MRRIPAVLAVLAAALALGACGEKHDTTSPGAAEPLNLVLDYLPNPDHVGIYQAIHDGDFTRAGLNVKPIVPSDPSAPLKLVAAGRADVAISYEPELLMARDRGLPLVAIGALVQVPLTSIISTGNKPVTSVAGLRGKTVGTAGIPYQAAYLKTILAHANVPPSSVRQVGVGFNLVPAMLSKRVGATLGAFWNIEGVQLARAHKKPRIIRIEQAGVPTYDELVLVARADTLRTQGAKIRSFLQALARGHRAVRRDPAAAAANLVAADKDLDAGDTRAQVGATLPTFFPSKRGAPFGFMDAAKWQAYARWMQANGLLKRPASPRALTNEFLPGEGL